MESYKKGDYALNKFSEGIVYRFADRIVEVTLENYLAENPGKTEQDFLELKALSDEIYHDQDLADNRYNKRKRTLNGMEEADKPSALSMDEQFIRKHDETNARKAADRLLHSGKLTEIQQRRFVQHFFQGLSIRQIAALDNVDYRAVWDSLHWASKKLKNFFSE